MATSTPTTRRLWRPVLGVLLLVFLLFTLDLSKLYALAFAIDWYWYLLALLLSCMNQLTSAWRWQFVVKRLGLSLSWRRAIDFYLQGLTVNAVLPGGIIGGDALRAGALAQYNRQLSSRSSRSVTSVLIDRLSGFWGLALVSLFALPALTAAVARSTPTAAAYFDFYSTGLITIAAAPLLMILLASIRIEYSGATTLARLTNLMPETLPLSLMVQICACLSFWACLRAVGIEISPALASAMGAAIFVAASLPASVGGFGSREMGAVFVFSALNLSTEAAFAASVLYGLTNTLMALAYLIVPYCWDLMRRPGKTTGAWP